MIVLAIETSTARGSVALVAGDDLLFEARFVAARGHGAALFDILQQARATAPHWDRVAVGLGPGSYAGVRTAIAAGLGLEVTTGAVLLGLPSPLVWETGVPAYGAIGDARRGACYWTEVAGDRCLRGPELLPLEEAAEVMRSSALPIFSTDLSGGIFGAVRPAWPSAVRLGRLGAIAANPESTASLEPLYLRLANVTPPAAGA